LRLGEVRDVIFVVGALVIVVFFIVRQRRSDRYEERSVIFPVGLGTYGVVILNGAAKAHPITAASAGLLGLSGAASVVFGIVRGRTIELFERNGELWERATWATIAGWGGLLVTRVIIIAVAAVIGATLAASASSIPLMLAVTLATQMIVVGQRARDTGLAIPSRSKRRRLRR
jgi:hypothetical protein